MAYQGTEGADVHLTIGMNDTGIFLKGGDDTLIADNWINSSADGGSGHDIFKISPEANVDQITLFGDTILNFEEIHCIDNASAYIDFRYQSGVIYLTGQLDDEVHAGSYSVVNTGSGNDKIFIYNGQSRVFALDGDDIMYSMGTTGINQFTGGIGNDKYYIRYNDVIVEDANAGIDTAIVNFNYSLGSNLENVEVVGANSLVNGNALSNLMKITGADNGNILHGMDGNDRVYGNVNFATGETLYGDAGRDTLRGYGGTDVLHGGTGNDWLVGGDGDDTLHGDEGKDVLLGGAGIDYMFGGADNDVFVGGAGMNYMDGGDGIDYVRYATSASGVMVSLYQNGIQDTGMSMDQLVNIECVVGSAFDDIISGDTETNLLIGGNGSDILDGAAGNDRLYGGLGDDFLDGGADRDIMTGGAGADIFRFHSVSDFLDATQGAADEIRDFRSAQGDKIHLGSFRDGPDKGMSIDFTFIGNADFSSQAGELRSFQAQGNTYVSGDVDGDGTADFMIRLNGLITLQESDFIF